MSSFRFCFRKRCKQRSKSGYLNDDVTLGRYPQSMNDDGQYAQVISVDRPRDGSDVISPYAEVGLDSQYGDAIAAPTRPKSSKKAAPSKKKRRNPFTSTQSTEPTVVRHTEAPSGELYAVSSKAKDKSSQATKASPTVDPEVGKSEIRYRRGPDGDLYAMPQKRTHNSENGTVF